MTDQPCSDRRMCDGGVRRLGGPVASTSSHSASSGGMGFPFFRRWICVSRRRDGFAEAPRLVGSGSISFYLIPHGIGGEGVD